MACVRPWVNTEQSARNEGVYSCTRLTSARTPLRTSQTVAEPSNRSSEHRAEVSISVTSAVAAAGGTVVIEREWERLLVRRVFLHRELHRHVDGQLHNARLLVDPRIVDGLVVLLLAELGQVLLALLRRMDAVVGVRSGLAREIDVVNDREEQRETHEHGQHRDEGSGSGRMITHWCSGFRDSGFRRCGGPG